jgi:hypothetical protein
MFQEIGLLRIPVLPRPDSRPVVTEETSALVNRANELSAQGDKVAAMILDDIAFVLERGKTWEQVLDDVCVSAPLVN